MLTPHSQKYMKFCREVCLQWNGIVINQRSAKYASKKVPSIEHSVTGCHRSQDRCFQKNPPVEHSTTLVVPLIKYSSRMVFESNSFNLLGRTHTTHTTHTGMSPPVKHSTTGCAVDHVVAHLVRLPVPRLTLTFIGA